MRMTIITTTGEEMSRDIKEMSKQRQKDIRGAMVGCGTDHHKTGEYVEIADVVFDQ